MLWLIENITKEPSYLALAAAVRRAGLSCQEISGDFAVADIEHLMTQPSPVIFCGSIEMTKLVHSHLEPTCAPLGYSNFAKYLCTSYYPVFGALLFNDRYLMLPFGDLRRQKQLVFETFGREQTIFIRPDSGDKPFKAGLITEEDFDAFCDQFSYLVSDLVIISTPKTILGEWRFIVDRTQRILAVSSYRLGSAIRREPSAPPECFTFCQKVLSVGYHPDSIYAVDVAQDTDGNCWLMELTSFSSAGLYACDPDAIVHGVTAIAREDFALRFPTASPR